ncbi:MAG: ABC transporter ATP-binding protein [Bacillota bacterium]
MSSKIIEVNRLSKKYTTVSALDTVSFSIRQGEVVSLLGPNGAGKTTILSIILGLLTPTAGSVRLLGMDPRNQLVKQRIGVMFQETGLMDRLTVRELLKLFRSYYTKPLLLDDMIRITGLTTKELQNKVEYLSGGQKRRVNFALAVAGNPEVLILDEPTNGLDAISRASFWQGVTQLANQGKTIIFTTHYLHEADDIANRIILFNKGRVIANGSSDEIKEKLSKQYVSFKINNDTGIPQLKHPAIIGIEQRYDRIYIETKDTDSIVSYITQHQTNTYDIQIDKGKMEDVFHTLVKEGSK